MPRSCAPTIRALKTVSPRNIAVAGMSLTYGKKRPRDWARWMRLPNGKPAPLDQYGHSSFTFRFAIPRYAPRAEHPGARVLPRPSADAGERDP